MREHGEELGRSAGEGYEEDRVVLCVCEVLISLLQEKKRRKGYEKCGKTLTKEK